MTRSGLHLVAAAVVALGGFATGWSCGGPTGGSTTAMGTSPRNLTPDSTTAELAELVRGNTAFGLDLTAALRARADGNLMISPASIAPTVAMAWAGARGTTADEIAATLHFTLPAARLHNAFNALDLALASRIAEGLTLKTANSLWAQRDYELLPDYLEVLAVNYGAPVRLLDFKRDPEACRLTINDWVSEQTMQKIPELLPEHALDGNTRFVLTNAIYFKASWAVPFDPDRTGPGTFHRADGSDVAVQMMPLGKDLGYASGAGWQAVDLQYVGGQTSMVVVVPDLGQLAAFEAAITADQVQSLFASLATRPVQLSLPKFGFKNVFALKEALQSLGMVQAWTTAADFSGMVLPTTDALHLAEAYHDTFITVTEDGTEAGAATGIVVEAQSDAGMPGAVDLIVDRPFLFFIRDVSTGAVLFAGRVLDPTAP